MTEEQKEALKLLRNQWFSFIQWTAGISALLITAEIVVFSQKDISDFSKGFLCASVMVLLANIILCWIVIKRQFLEYIKILLSVKLKMKVIPKT